MTTPSEQVGRRVPWPVDALPFEVAPTLAPGDYAGPFHGLWLLRSPNGYWGSAGPYHIIEEHEDGTITVTPSTVFSGGNDLLHIEQPGTTTHCGWHGWLRRGVWSEA